MKTCFYRTYEELKLCFSSLLNPTLSISFLSYLWGIETYVPSTGVYYSRYCFYRTYEELKPKAYRTECWIFVGFYRTYEELKLKSANSIQRWLSSVFIVPMRNWNAKFGWRERKMAAVFIVPMRNWNLVGVSYEHKRRWRVFIVPMRNWNQKE